MSHHPSIGQRTWSELSRHWLVLTALLLFSVAWALSALAAILITSYALYGGCY